RTNFTAVEGSVKQFIHPDDKSKFSLEHFDLTEDDDQLESANQIAEDELNYVFDLENDSLLRANMIKLSDDKHILILTLHHIIADGWSLRILMMELSQLYYMYQNDADLDLNPMPIQYKDYTYWHNDLVINQDEAYWLKKLENPPEFVDLPYDGPTEKDSSVRDLYKMLKLEGDDFIKLKELAATSETTLSNLMLSAYSIMLNKISGQDDVVIGIGHANRNHPDLENLIGFFVNLLPIRVLFDEEDDFKSIVGKVSTSTIEAFEHSNYPFELLIEKVCPDRFSNSQPLVNVLYDYKNYHDLDINKEDWDLSPTLKVTPFQKFRNRSKFDLTLFVYQYEDSIQLYFEYDDLKFSEKTIDRMNLLLMNICNLLIEAQ
ncbi:MAG: condensation domain-containing protein, partial [Bacteroidota bacterium]